MDFPPFEGASFGTEGGLEGHHPPGHTGAINQGQNLFRRGNIRRVGASLLD